MTPAPTAPTRPRTGRSRGTRSRTGPGGSSSAQERFEKRLSARRRRTWKLIAALVLLAGLAVGGWWVLWRSDWLLVEEVVVTGVEPRWEEQIRAAADLTIGEPLVQVKSSVTEQAVREVPIVADVHVVHSWPSAVTIKVTSREPVLAVQTSSQGLAVVDADGVVIETVAEAPASLPLVRAVGADAVTQQAYRAAWSVVSSLPRSISQQLTSTTLTSAELVTFELGERTLTWGGPEDAELKAEVAQVLLATDALRIDVSAPRSPVTEGAVAPAEDSES